MCDAGFTLIAEGTYNLVPPGKVHEVILIAPAANECGGALTPGTPQYYAQGGTYGNTYFCTPDGYVSWIPDPSQSTCMREFDIDTGPKTFTPQDAVEIGGAILGCWAAIYAIKFLARAARA